MTTDASRAYDPIADLAAFIDGMHAWVQAGLPTDGLVDLLAGPYARLRGGLLLDEPEPAAPRGGTDQALREALQAYITKTGHLITQDEIEGWVAEAERGYEPGDFAPPPHPELGPGSGHQVDGPAGCPRCQLLRDNQGWMKLS